MTSPSTATDRRECHCGYDLAGINGPPWICPECGMVTPEVLPWWGDRQAAITFTRRDRIRIGIGSGVLLFGSAAAPWPWLWDWRLAKYVPILIAMAAAAHLATTVAVWMTRGERSWRFAKGIIPWILMFGFACGVGLGVGMAAAFLFLQWR